MRIFVALTLTLALVPAVLVAAPAPVDPIETVLRSCATPESLRDRLAALAANAPSPRIAARARQLRGQSFEHAAMPDSAIECYRLANTVGRFSPALNELVDALLRRRAPGDVDEAIKVLESMQAYEQETGRQAAHVDPARLGWAYVVAGQTKRGLEILTPLEPRLVDDPVWQYRFARAYLDAGASTPALKYLLALNTEARGQDREIASMIKHVDNMLGVNAEIKNRTQQALKEHDDDEIALLDRLKGRRVRLLASDGAMIGGAVFADSTVKRPARAALVLAGTGDELRDYDSLTVALRKSGFAMFLLDPRGSGWSVAPDFSLPDTWTGRQDALTSRVTRDVRDGITAFARVARIDTSRVLLIGVGPMGPIAIKAAAQDPRVGALVLLDPWTSPVDRGATLAAAAQVPVAAYLQLSVAGHTEAVFADTLLHTFTAQGSRLVELPALGSGAGMFGSRPDATPRFVRWISETFNAKPVKRVAPRTAPRPK